MTLTKKLAIKLHRKLWNWIADETIRQKRKVRKSEYPLFAKYIYIDHDCWCCYYARKEERRLECDWGSIDCFYCPLQWKHGTCIADSSEFFKWDKAKTWQEAAHWARIIAELPERDERKEQKEQVR